MNLAQAMSLEQELAAMGPPPSVMRAGKIIITIAASGGRPPSDLIEYVQSWIALRQRQNRYGK